MVWDVVLSHQLESEPRTGLLSWASKTSLFMSQVSYYTKDHFNMGREEGFAAQSCENAYFFLLQSTRLHYNSLNMHYMSSYQNKNIFVFAWHHKHMRARTHIHTHTCGEHADSLSVLNKKATKHLSLFTDCIFAPISLFCHLGKNKYLGEIITKVRNILSSFTLPP